jgi:AcrR family transcriptional regulator
VTSIENKLNSKKNEMESSETGSRLLRPMVATPWGDSEKLNARRLTPGPGTSPEAVAENQRGRIFGAMVATVADLGYEKTRIADVAELSGVSSRSIYNLFPGGKDECFIEVLEQILNGTLAVLTTVSEGSGDWEQRFRATYTKLAEIIAEQPATASLMLTEAYAAGPAATEALDRATGAFERLSRRRLKESPERTGLPTMMVEAQVGALQELARTRLRRGEADSLGMLIPELVDLIGGYRPPPSRLKKTARRPSVEQESVTSPDEAERAIQGFVLAVAAHGYAGATIQEIARQGGMSTTTFYANFRDKRMALLAAIDSSTAQLQALAMAAYRRSPGWASGVRAMIGSAFNFLAARPATANILLVEVYAGGSEALRVRAQGFSELTRALDEGANGNPAVPKIASEVISGGIVALARRQYMRKGAASLSSLAPIASYIALSPYIGAEEACAAANGDGRARPRKQAGPGLPRAHSTPNKWVITSMLGDRWATAEEIGGELGTPVGEIVRELEELEAEGLVEHIDSVDDAKPAEWTNAKFFRLIDGDDWAALTVEERRRFLREAARLAIDDLNASLGGDTYGRRLDEHHIRMVVELDEEGWKEFGEIHRAAFNASQAVQEKSRKRVAESGGKMTVGRSIQLLFEASADNF